MIRGVLFCFMAIIACTKAPQKVDKDPDSGFITTYTLSGEDQGYHGPYTKTDSTGVLLEKGTYVNGKLQGIREIYFPDGTVKVRERYDEGQINDLYEYFYANGRHELMGYYIDGAMYGSWKKFDDKGNLIEIVTMVDNEEMGPFVEYYPNGNKQAEGVYLHGPNEDGQLNLFDESGELYKTMLCDSGRCVTTWEKK